MGREHSFPFLLAPTPEPHARGQRRKCQAILAIHSSWGDKVFLRPPRPWLDSVRDTNPRTLSGSLSALAANKAHSAGSQSYPGSPHQKKRKASKCQGQLIASSMLNILTFLCVRPQGM